MARTKSEYSGEIKLGRAFGLGGGIALVVGSIIGMGIYALLAPITANAGTAMWLAFTLAVILSAVGVIPIIQGSSAIPRAGLAYLAISRLSNPYLGSITSLWAILGGACATCFVCIGFAGNIAAYWTWSIEQALEIKILSLLIPLLFIGLYLFKLQLANWLQIIMVILKVLALLLFIIVGLFALPQPIRLSFFSPRGLSGMVLAVILCYSACMGFQVIAEMGEEMKNPKRNIPLAMAIGGIIVLLIYVFTGIVFSGSMPYNYEVLMKMKAPLLDSARTFLPEGLVAFIGFGAFFAALTALNAGAIALPREILSLARDELLPSALGRVNARTLTPLPAVILYFLVVFILLCFQFINIDLDFYGVMAAVGILLMTVISAFAIINLPSRYPSYYKRAFIRIPRAWLIVLAVLTALTSLPFVVLVLLDYKNTALILRLLIGVTLLFSLYYVLRVNWLKKRGVDWKERTRQITGHEEEEQLIRGI